MLLYVIVCVKMIINKVFGVWVACGVFVLWWAVLGVCQGLVWGSGFAPVGWGVVQKSVVCCVCP